MRPTPAASRLVVTPGSIAARCGDDLLLDDKAVSGLAQYARHWPGRVHGVFREGPAAAIPFGRRRDPRELPFDVSLIAAGAPAPAEVVSGAAVVLASGDNYLDLPLARACQAQGVPLVYVIENTLRTRLRILAFEDRPLSARLRSAVWHMLTEVRRRAAFRRAAGLAANGIPASRSYGKFGNETITFFDTRMTRAMLATPRELRAKVERLGRGEPLRLGFSGRLERLKGVDHLVPLARHLADAGLPFSLHIYGSGSLAADLREQVRSAGLARQVSLHGSVDFETQLVPSFRTGIDLFVCCHRQSDPSCTYMEAMGCAVPVAGYGNQALRGLLTLADAGLVTQDRPEALAQAIVSLASRPQDHAAMMRAALDLSSLHDFETTFQRRVEQCVRVARRVSEREPGS